MVDPTPIPGLSDKIEKINERQKATGGLGSGGHGPTDSLERRVTTLEKAVDKMNGKLDAIIETISATRLALTERLAAIEGKLDGKASATELAEVKGRANALPTTWQMILLVAGTVFTILGGAFLILKFGLPHGP